MALAPVSLSGPAFAVALPSRQEARAEATQRRQEAAEQRAAIQAQRDEAIAAYREQQTIRTQESANAATRPEPLAPPAQPDTQEIEDQRAQEAFDAQRLAEQQAEDEAEQERIAEQRLEAQRVAESYQPVERAPAYALDLSL